MIELICKLSFLTSVWVLGVKIATGQGMLFEQVADYCEGKVNDGKRIFKPLCTCVWCMPSLHTAVGFLFAFLLGMIEAFKPEYAIVYIVVCMLSSLVSGFVWSVLELISSYTKLVDNKEQLTHYDIKDRQKDHYLKTHKIDRYAYSKKNGLQSERK